MFNNTGIKTEKAGGPVQILFNVQNQMSVGIKVNKGVTPVVTENNRKIIKAGTPLTGDLTDRTTAFTKAGEDDAVGVLLHDVDVTDTDANGTLLIWGFVNLDRLDSATEALITSGVKDALAGRVWFLKDN